MKKTPYEDLPLLPNIIAEAVCSQPYTGQEWSQGLRSGDEITKIELARQQMTPDQVQDFANLCDTKCCLAYHLGAKWFLACVKAKNNYGRDQLYVWIRHWLASYLKDPNVLRLHCKVK